MALALQQLAYGDTNYIGKHNANYTSIQSEVNAILTQYQRADARAMPGGYASLDGSGVMPLGQMPAHTHTEYQEKAARGQPGGYCDLDGTGKIPVARMPSVTLDFSTYQTTTLRGQPNGYASLDGAGKVPTAQIPDLSATYETVTHAAATFQTIANLGATYCPLVGGMVPDEYLPPALDLSGYELAAHALATYETAAHAAATYATIAELVSYLTKTAAAATYATIASLASYLTKTAAAATYETIANAASTYIPLAQRGAASGVATLDGSGLVPLTQLPLLDPGALTGVEVLANKGAVSGYCPLDASQHVPAANLVAANIPDLSATYETGAHAAATYAPIVQPFDIGLAPFPGKPTGGQTMLRAVLARTVAFPAGLATSRASSGTAATASTVISLQKNGVDFGTVTFALGGSTGTFASASGATFAAGDLLTIVAPGSADATLADISITLAGTR